MSRATHFKDSLCKSNNSAAHFIQLIKIVINSLNQIQSLPPADNPLKLTLASHPPAYSAFTISTTRGKGKIIADRLYTRVKSTNNYACSCGVKGEQTATTYQNLGIHLQTAHAGYLEKLLAHSIENGNLIHINEV